MSRGDSSESERAPNYHVPALEKGLDILEYLASQAAPQTQAQIARALRRGPNELFRMLTTLERRRYIERDPLSGAYRLTLRLFELSHTHSPLNGLLRAAARPMQQLTETLGESCHLSVIQRGQLLVLAQEESRTRVRISVEVGGLFPLMHTVSGRVLLAALDDDLRHETLGAVEEYAQLTNEERSTFHEKLAAIRAQGYDTAWGETTEGVCDVAVLVGATTSHIKAALTITALSRERSSFVAQMLPALKDCADAVAQNAGIAP